MLKLWGRLSSLNVQKVVWCAGELGIPVERIDAGGSFGGLDTPESLRRNPNRKIPVIDDDGFVLWESNAIVRYLGAKHDDGTLWPRAVTERADVDRWMDWQATELNPAMRDVFVQLVRTPEARRNLALAEASAQACEALYALLDDHLAGRTYVAGDRFTLADIPLGLQTHRWLGLPCARVARPHVQAWYERLRTRPAAAEVLSLPVN